MTKAEAVELAMVQVHCRTGAEGDAPADTACGLAGYVPKKGATWLDAPRAWRCQVCQDVVNSWGPK